jgi:hypothetical protein
MTARTTLLVGMMVATALSRVLWHPANFTPVLAVALFGAAHFRSRWAALLVPQAAMLLSDAALEVLTRQGLLSGWLGQGQGFYQGMWVVYATVALVGILGLALRRDASFSAVVDGVLGGSVLFFLVTNFAWWAGYGLYPHTWEGLALSYLAGVPFFGGTLAGTAFYSAILFGGFAVAQRRFPELQPAVA